MKDEAKTVTVDEVIFASDDGRFTVVSGTSEREGATVVLVGDLGQVAVGETLAVRGRAQTHPVYGPRFQVDSFTPVTPQTRAGVTRYLGSGLVPGVGPALAERIVARFGDATLDVVMSQSARLTEVSGIGRKRAEAIAGAVRSRYEEAQALSYLHGLGLGPALAKRIRHKYGNDTVRVLRGDPYLVAEEVKGVGFRTADRIGQALGYEADDPRRAAGAALHLVGKAADDGHVFLPLGELIEQGRKLDVPEATLARAVEELAQRQMLVVEDGRVYAPPLHRAEVEAAVWLGALAARKPRPVDMRRALGAIAGHDLAEAQAQAVEASLRHSLFVLTGGPGTGKTTTVRAIVDGQQRVGRRVCLCAPTGRAAKRLSETTGAEALTIHRLLEYNPATGGFQRGPDAPLEADLVLVDEASMLDLQLAHKLLGAIPAGCALALVGDVDQLPPVGAGPVLRELLTSQLCPVIRLTQVFRQAQRSAIVRAAHDILHDLRPRATPAGERGEGDLFIVRASDPELVCQRLLESLARVGPAYGLDPKRDVQVLSPMRRGPLGTERLNELVQQALNPEGARGPLGLRRGDKVMQLRNDYERDVFNGDLGVVLETGRASAVVDVGGRRVNYEGDALESLALAYASTIHKVQGSEFPGVIVVLHGMHYMLLSRALIYTAITRARKLAVILGDDRAIDRAVRNTSVQRTHCRLSERLRR